MSEYFIKRPTQKNKRKTFAIIRRIINAEGQQQNKTISHPTLLTLNKAFSSGQIDEKYATLQVRALATQLRREESPLAPLLVHNPENQKLLDRFWEGKYKRRKLEDPDSIYADYRRAVEAVGNVSLYAAGQDEIQDAVDRHCKGSAKRQRRVLARLETILKHIGRSMEFEKEKEPPRDVHYVTEEEMLRISAHLSSPFNLLAQAAFYSGLRLGELFALDRTHFKGKWLNVQWQLKEEKITKLPKRDKRRKAYLPPSGRKAVEQWCAVGVETKMELRKLSYSKIFRAACRKVFPGVSSKHLTFHDLRHSYAIFMLGKNINLSLVAKSLGNSNEVCEKYYAGFSANDADIEAMDVIIGRDGESE